MKNSTYPALSGQPRTYQRFKSAVFLLLFSVFVLPALAQTVPTPIEVRLQPGQTAVRQVTVTNPADAPVNFQTAIKETTASLARWTLGPTSFDDLNVVFSTGFEDYPVGEFNTQNGWVDKVLAEYPNFTFGNSIPVEATVSTAEPLNGEKHLAYASIDTNQIYDSYSPLIEAEQTSAVRSAVLNVKLTGTESSFVIYTYQNDVAANGNPKPPLLGANFQILPGGRVFYFEGGTNNFLRAPFTFSADQEYVEVRFVVNQIAKTFEVYLDGQRVVEATRTNNAIIDGIAVTGYNNFVFPKFDTPFGPSLYVDDVTIADGDASTPDWLSTLTTSGTLPAQGERTLDVTVDAQGLEPGIYEAEVQVLDEAFGTVSTVPVTLIVEEPPVNPVVENLNLTSMCSDDPETELRWRIRNPNDFDVAVAWQVYGSTQADTVLATPGDSFFFTQTEPGANTTIIRWKDENGQTKQRTKASGKDPCQPVVAQPKLLAYPTIIENELTLEIDGAGEGKLFIFSERYALIYRAKVAPGTNLVLSADELRLQSGVTYYILLAIPGPNGWAIRKQTVLKQ